MFNKYIELNNIQKQKYEAIEEEMRIKKAKDRTTLFDQVYKDFFKKYNTDVFFFGENFFQKIADEYRSINKRAVEYYNNTNKEISVSRTAMLRKYGFQTDKEYREIIQYDKSKEIIGLPNYLNPEKSLKVIKKKLLDPFIELYNISFFEKAASLMKMEIERVKNGEANLIDKDGHNHFEVALNDLQLVMLSYLYFRLNACEALDLEKIAYGKINYNEFREFLNDELEKRNEKIMKYTLKQETLDRFKKISRAKMKKEVRSDYSAMCKEYIKNKNAVFGYRKDYDVNRTISELQTNDIKSYGQRITYLQLFKAKLNTKGFAYKFNHSFENKMIKKYDRMLPLRYIDIDRSQMYNDVKTRDFKSILTYKYEDVCSNIEESIMNLGMLMSYTYQMDKEVYNQQILSQLSDLEIDLRRQFNMTDDDYEEIEDARIKEVLGPQYLVGYHEEANDNQDEAPIEAEVGKKKKKRKVKY